jgi:hypothetical protein
MATFALKVYVGPVAVKQVAEKLRAIAGVDSISEGTEAVYFTLSDEPDHDAARTRAQGMIRFAGIRDIWVRKV